MAVEMFLDDPEKSVILGVPPSKPKIVNAFYEATELDKKGDKKGAERIYLELLNADFDNSCVLAALGMCYATQERNGLAAVLLSEALKRCDNILADFKRLGVVPKCSSAQDEAAFLKIKRSEILNALGTCYKHENKTERARELFLEAQEGIILNPDIQNNLGTIYINEGKPEVALQYMNAALSVDPNHAQAHWNKSLALLETGNYEQGWKEYDWGFKANVRIERNYSKDPIPNWDGSKGKTIVVYGEQGIGDEILFASMLPDLIKDCKLVIFECHKKLHTLFGNSFPSIDIYPTREDPVLNWPVKQDGTLRYPIDAKIAIGSLGQFYRNSIESFPAIPYISPTVVMEAEWAMRLNKLGPRPKIGISWIGGHKRTRMEVRSLQLKQLLPILLQDADFISLQYTPAEDEIAAFEAETGIKLHHFPEANYSSNYDDEAGLVANLDLVITVCTSLVHLASSMGVPTWVMTPSRPAWRYRLDMDTIPWYPKTTLLFRQAEDTFDWTPVIEEVSTSLTELLNSKEAS